MISGYSLVPSLSWFERISNLKNETEIWIKVDVTLLYTPFKLILVKDKTLFVVHFLGFHRENGQMGATDHSANAYVFLGRSRKLSHRLNPPNCHAIKYWPLKLCTYISLKKKNVTILKSHFEWTILPWFVKINWLGFQRDSSK